MRLTKEKRQVINTIFEQYLQFQRTQKARQKAWMDWTDVAHYALDALVSGHHYRQRYDVILIDEAQDFAPVWIKVIKQLLKPNGTLTVCDDPTQSLFRAYSWKEKGLEVVGRTRILRIPFRSTRQISQAAHSVIQADASLKDHEDITAPNFKTYELLDGDIPLLRQC